MFEILHTSAAVKYRKFGKKGGCFWKLLGWRALFFVNRRRVKTKIVKWNKKRWMFRKTFSFKIMESIKPLV